MRVAPDAGAAGSRPLVRTALDRASAAGLPEARRWVVDNTLPARGCDGRAGFAPKGIAQPLPRDPSVRELEMDDGYVWRRSDPPVTKRLAEAFRYVNELVACAEGGLVALTETRRTLKNWLSDLAIVAVPMTLGPDDARTTTALQASGLRRTPPPAVASPVRQFEAGMVAPPR